MSNMSEVHRICTEITEDWTPASFAEVVNMGVPVGLRMRIDTMAQASGLNTLDVIELFRGFCAEQAPSPVTFDDVVEHLNASVWYWEQNLPADAGPTERDDLAAAKSILARAIAQQN